MIIGAQKSGTTSAYSYINDHPSVRRAARKEVHYFDLHYRRSVAWYQSFFPMGNGRRRWVTGEASPSYMMDPQVPQRVHDLIPDVRIVVLLRDPIERAYSHFNHMRETGVEPIGNFVEALEAEQERMQEVDSFGEASIMRLRFAYARRGFYGEQLQRWFDLFPRNSIRVFLTTELANSSQTFASAAYSFLQLPPHRLRNTKVRNSRSYDPMPVMAYERLSKIYAEDGAVVEKLTGLSVPWASR